MEERKGIWARWHQLISSFDFELAPPTRRPDRPADALARRQGVPEDAEIEPETAEDLRHAVEEVQAVQPPPVPAPPQLTDQEIRRAQQSCFSLRTLHDLVKKGTPPSPTAVSYTHLTLPTIWQV